MSKSILNIYYRETLDKVDSYEDYLTNMNITLDTQLWKKSLSVNNMSAYKKYLNEYPKGAYYDEAQLKIDEFTKIEKRNKETNDWDKASNQNTQSSYETYLMYYYDGIYSNEAKRKVDEFIRLKKEELLEKQRLRDIENAKERIRLEKIEQEQKLALNKEKEAWELVCRKDTKEDYENYLKFYSHGIYYLEATQNIQKIVNIEAKRIREIAIKEEDKVWEKACKEDKSWAYLKYLEEYPNGIYFDEAQSLSEMLNIEITTKEYPNNRLFIFNVNGKKGVLNREKKVIVEAKYREILTLSDRFIYVNDDGKEGLISVDGKVILELGNYNLRVDGGGYKTEIIKQHNPNDDFIVSAIRYDKQWIYNSNFMKMFDTSVIKILDMKNNTFGYISNDNKLLLKPIYKEIFLYKNGVGVISKDGGLHGLCGLINSKFKITLEDKYGYMRFESNNEEYTTINNKDWSKRGIINTKGKIVISLAFDDINDLENGFFITQKGNYFGLINNKGKMVINAIYDTITYLKNENIFLLYKDKKFGFTNNKGEITIYPELDFEHSDTDFIKYYFRGHVFDEKENLLLVYRNQKLGLVDKEGEYVLPPIFDTIDDYDNKYLKVMFVRQEHQSGFVDKRGKYILDLGTYELNRPYDYSIISTIKLRNINPLIGLINWHTGKIILPIKYKSLSCERIDNNIYKFTSGLKSGLIDVNGKIILDLVNILKFNSLKKKFL